MASMITPASEMTDSVADGVPVAAALSAHECAHCRSAVTAGERWVRQKIYEPFAGNAPRYRRYHADLFVGEELSCWEKYEMERDLVRTAGRAA
jgi:hypothetical protein